MKSVSLLLAASLAATTALAAPGCMTELDLDSEAIELSVWSWAEDVKIPNQSSARQVGLAWYGNQSYMVHNGSGTPSELWWSRRDEATKAWSTNVKIENQRAEGGPALVVHDGRLQMIYRAARELKLVMSTFDPSTSRWSSPVDAGTATSHQRITSAPSAVVVGDRIYLAYAKKSGGKHRVMVDMYAGGRWEAAGELIAWDVELPHVAIGNTGDQLHVVWTTFHDDPYIRSLWTMWTVDGRIQPGTPAWGGAQKFGWKSKKPVSILSCGGNTHLLHGGHDDANEIYWSYRVNGQWAEHAKVPGQASDDGAALGCAGGQQVYMVHNGGTDQLWYSEFR